MYGFNVVVKAMALGLRTLNDRLVVVMALVMLGLFALNAQGIEGGILQMIV